MKQKLVIIGNGMAPGRALERLVELAPDAYDVTIFNAEQRVNYDRIMLSPVLSGEKSFEDIIIHGDGWYIEHGITLYKGHKVVAVDRAAKTVTSAHGAVETYDKLVFATGSNPIVIPVPGHDLAGVLTYRDLDDVDAMLLAAKSRGRAVVIGGGLLGLEAAAGLALQGMMVTVIHLMPTLMERQLDPAAGYLLQKELERRGIEVRCKANTQAILATEGAHPRVRAVRLDDGTELPADLVVMAVGIRPNLALAKEAGLTVGRGIVVSPSMQTSDPDIYAVGECVEASGQCFGLVAPLYEMANIVAEQLAGSSDAAFKPTATATKLKVTGVNLFSAGDFADGPGREEIVLRDAAQNIYKRLVIQDSKLIGVVLYGETQDGAWFFDLLKKSTDISDLRETLIFGQSYAGGASADPTAAVAALPDDAEICGCNGVCKSRIVSAITSKGLTSLDDVRAHTKASSSCGSCTGLVEQLMALTLGAAYNPAAVLPMCKCTDLGHDDVRRLIVAKGLKSIPALMQELEWSTSCGCAKCRPALNYYLLATWPGEYVDDNQSRFINERVHANIQKDGTFSVVPRMWGGMTSAKELRAIADVVEKFAIPSVKVTGGQRIDMLGVKKEDLPAVWADLNAAGMVSGAAYAKGLRTVKTCVGTDWCRFGTQDSTGLGIRIEKFMWGSWTPAKVKMAVSGCPRNCAEATCKDVGVVCVDSGYDIHFAGAAGLDIKSTEVLCHVATEDETLEIIVALVQLYRERGRYLERIYKWTKRTGIDAIRALVVDDLESRKVLFERFVHSQKFAQVDPWAERAQGKDAHEFRPMADLARMEAAE
jgi:nitrite reductase (NADH) large subunit